MGEAPRVTVVFVSVFDEFIHGNLQSRLESITLGITTVIVVES